jgi:hypothetical protein
VSPLVLVSLLDASLSPPDGSWLTYGASVAMKWGGCCWAGVFAFPLVKTLRSTGAEQARRTLTHARGPGCNLAALDLDGGALDSDSRTPACGSKEVHQRRLSQIDCS